MLFSRFIQGLGALSLIQFAAAAKEPLIPRQNETAPSTGVDEAAAPTGVDETAATSVGAGEAVEASTGVDEAASASTGVDEASEDGYHADTWWWWHHKKTVTVTCTVTETETAEVTYATPNPECSHQQACLTEEQQNRSRSYGICQCHHKHPRSYGVR